jgi:hypothetical protein
MEERLNHHNSATLNWPSQVDAGERRGRGEEPPIQRSLSDHCCEAACMDKSAERPDSF